MRRGVIARTARRVFRKRKSFCVGIMSKRLFANEDRQDFPALNGKKYDTPWGKMTVSSAYTLNGAGAFGDGVDVDIEGTMEVNEAGAALLAEEHGGKPEDYIGESFTVDSGDGDFVFTYWAPMEKDTWDLSPEEQDKKAVEAVSKIDISDPSNLWPDYSFIAGNKIDKESLQKKSDKQDVGEEGSADDQSSEWRDAGFDATAEKTWSGYGFGAGDASAWKEAGFKANNANSWKEAGMGPDDALSAREEGKSPSSIKKEDGFTRHIGRIARTARRVFRKSRKFRAQLTGDGDWGQTPYWAIQKIKGWIENNWFIPVEIQSVRISTSYGSADFSVDVNLLLGGRQFYTKSFNVWVSKNKVETSDGGYV